MDWIKFIGLVAATLTTSALVPQIVKSYATKKTEDLSLLTYTVAGIGVILWLVYGFLINDTPIILSNVVSVVFIFIMLYFKVRYGRK